MWAKVDFEKCVGCGLCTAIAEESFRMNGDGKAECCAEGTEELIWEAIDSCPVAAISEV